MIVILIIGAIFVVINVFRGGFKAILLHNILFPVLLFGVSVLFDFADQRSMPIEAYNQYGPFLFIFVLIFYVCLGFGIVWNIFRYGFMLFWKSFLSNKFEFRKKTKTGTFIDNETGEKTEWEREEDGPWRKKD